MCLYPSKRQWYRFSEGPRMTTEFMATGWGAIDQAAEPCAFIRYLDAVSALETIQRIRNGPTIYSRLEKVTGFWTLAAVWETMCTPWHSEWDARDVLSVSIAVERWSARHATE